MYSARVTVPENDNKYYIHTSKGGLNSCILIKDNSVLPNCVGYAWGRFYEILGSKPKLSRGNAEDWFNYKDGYKRGSDPKLGSVACWSKGRIGVDSDGAGHVAIVEEIADDGTIVVSESAYKGFLFRLHTLKPPYFLSGYNFQGFIYNPAVSETTQTTVKSSGGVNLYLSILKEGSKGNQVKTLQRLLYCINGSPKDLAIDGIFGSKTLSYVKSFQAKNSLTVDGIVGQNTWTKLLK